VGESEDTLVDRVTVETHLLVEVRPVEGEPDQAVDVDDEHAVDRHPDE